MLRWGFIRCSRPVCCYGVLDFGLLSRNCMVSKGNKKAANLFRLAASIATVMGYGYSVFMEGGGINQRCLSVLVNKQCIDCSTVRSPVYLKSNLHVILQTEPPIFLEISWSLRIQSGLYLFFLIF